MSLPFTPQDVIAAYEKTGIEPLSDFFSLVIDGRNCGCALTALYVSMADDHEAAFKEIHGKYDTDIHAIIANVIGCDEILLHPFITGFDRDRLAKKWESYDDFRAAYTLGVDTRKAVDEHFAKGSDET